ncbi:MAG: PAS domain-containing protein [Planctomycetota bacterium]|jgi:PAS domain S-box-containing protein
MGAPNTPSDAVSLTPEQVRQLADLSLDILTISGKEGRFTWVNEAATRVLGWSFAELTSRPYFELLHPDDVDRTQHELGAVLRGETVLDFENRYLHQDGSWRWLSWRCGPVSPDGVLIATARDVTEMRELKEAVAKPAGARELAEREAQLRAAERSVGFGTWTWNPADNAVAWSKSLYTLLGLSPDEPPSFERFFEVVHPEDVERVMSNAAAGAEAGELKPQRYRIIRHSDGAVRHIQATAGTAILDDAGNIATMAGALLDISDQVAADDALLRSEWVLREAQRVAAIGSWTFEPDTRVVTWSDEMYRLTGMPAGAPTGLTTLRDLVHPDDVARFDQAGLAEPLGDVSATPYRLRRRSDGEVRDVTTATRVLRNDEGDPLLVVGTTMDVTEHRRLEDDLRHAQKMEAIGRLAGGVAHDFNNSLTAIIGNAELAQLSLGDAATGTDAGDFLKAVIEAGEQAADVTRQLLAFARRQMVQPAVLDPAERLQAVQRLLRPMLGEDIRLEVQAEADGGRIRVDPGQLEQLLINLAVNARDAMPRGGVLGIACSRVEVGPSHAAHADGVAPGEYVRIAVSDTGSGMDDDTRDRAFEPFFTTKESGRGTGLGLATCHGIVMQNGGHILLDSAPGEGTTFRMFFPHVADAGERAERPAETGDRPSRGHETILVVEDEQPVLTMCAAALRRLGYRVIEAHDGRSAVEAAGAGTPIHLLLTDVVLPDMRGPEVARRVRELIPDCPVLFASGYTQDALGEGGAIDEDVDFIAKPYTPSELSRVVRDVLDAR